MTQTSFTKTRIVLVDDHPLMRQAQKMWIQSQQDLEVIAEAADGKEAVDIVTRLQPDVVVMDISMPKMNGLEATRAILSRCPRTKILIVTVHSDNEYILSLLRAGASGYLTKSATGIEIIHAIRTVISGEKVIPSDAGTNTINPTTTNPTERISGLTAREMDLLKLLAGGFSNKDISLRLGISLRRVKANLTVLFAKMGVTSRTEAISRALKSGIITVDEMKNQG